MDNNRPHGRQKRVGNGSVHAGRGGQIGSRPVGFGGRNEGSAPRGTGTGPSRGLPSLNLKTILILGVLAVVVLVVFKMCGGLSLPNVNDPGSNFSEAEVNDASYRDVDRTVSPLARKKYYTPAENDKVTVMVYMCGTDLESEYGMATKDLNEMLAATLSDNVNIIIETGGCKGWKNNFVSSNYNQIYKIGKDGLSCLEQNVGTASMTDPNNLTQFIRYAAQAAPADRRILIFWDHGGGSLSGYGYDEKNPQSSSMTLAKINSALKNAGTTFDFIGFDACLMATLETDLVCNNYADYLIGSEESEPGTGWYYTNFLTALAKNTAIPTIDLGKIIVDDFVNSCCSARSNAQVTLSVVDLAELDGTIPDSLRDFAAATNELVRSDDYAKISDARSGARQFAAKSKLNQVDLVDFAGRVGTKEATALASTVQSCVKYNKTTISRSHGVSIYFPFENTKTVSSAIASMNDIGKDDDYSECMGEYAACIRSFASLEYGGQIAASATQTTSSSSDLLGSLIASSSQGSTSPVSVLSGLFGGGSGYSMDASALASLLGGFSGRSMPTEYNWVDTSLIADKASDIAADFIDPARIKATVKDGKRVLTLTDAEWQNVTAVELNVFVKDGDGYIDLGLDNVFEWADDDSLLLSYDRTWLTLDGNVCAYYMVSDTQRSDGTWVTVGRIPAKLNGELVNLQVVFDERDHPDGILTGAYPLEESTDVQAKGDVPVSAGDKIELLCDYYGTDGGYLATYSLGAPFTANRLELMNLTLDNPEVSAMYRLTDRYGNHFWIEAE